MSSRRPTPDILSTEIPVADDFSFQIWREVFRTIVSNEKSAMETGEPVNIELESWLNLEEKTYATHRNHCRHFDFA